MNRSRTFFFLVLISLLTAIISLTCTTAESALSDSPADALQKAGVFSGAWFEIRYPAGFSARPSLKSSTAEGYDSAEFIAPEGEVSFYVFAPQWGGNPADIALVPEREQLVTEQRRQLADREIRWFTIAARDGSYRRSYQETVAQQGSVRTILGIKYRNEEARLRYQQAYQQFRKSLQLYAD